MEPKKNRINEQKRTKINSWIQKAGIYKRGWAKWVMVVSYMVTESK